MHKCPHCALAISGRYSIGPAPYEGLWYLCLRCGGYSKYVQIAGNKGLKLDKISQKEFDEIRNKPDAWLLKALREHFKNAESISDRPVNRKGR